MSSLISSKSGHHWIVDLYPNSHHPGLLEIIFTACVLFPPSLLSGGEEPVSTVTIRSGEEIVYTIGQKEEPESGEPTTEGPAGTPGQTPGPVTTEGELTTPSSAETETTFMSVSSTITNAKEVIVTIKDKDGDVVFTKVRRRLPIIIH